MRDGKRRDEYWAAGVGYGHHNRPGVFDTVFFVLLLSLFSKKMQTMIIIMAVGSRYCFVNKLCVIFWN